LTSRQPKRLRRSREVILVYLPNLTQPPPGDSYARDWAFQLDADND
jgi:hypothetical protein